jgi:hypothetical protein
MDSLVPPSPLAYPGVHNVATEHLSLPDLNVSYQRHLIVLLQCSE